MKKKAGTPGDPTAGSDLRALVESQNAEIAKIKKSAADSRRDKEKHMRETWQRHNPDGHNPDGDGNTKGGRKKKNTTAPPAPAQAAAASAAADGNVG
jgi:hypothetical protein